MRVAFARGTLAHESAPLVGLCLGTKELRPKWLPKELRDEPDAPLRLGDFTGKTLESVLLYPGRRRLLLVGLGDPGKVTAEVFRRAGAAVARTARKTRCRRAAVVLAREESVGLEDQVRALAEGLVLGSYVYGGQKTRDQELVPLEDVVLHLFPATRKNLLPVLREGLIGAQAQCLARDLGNHPGNKATASFLAAQARRIARQGGLRCRVLGLPELRRRKLGGLLAVNSGSREPPRFVELEYRPAKWKRTVCLVGKGLTFDAGGISLKPAAGMEEMKFDMCGGAAVFATLKAVAELRLRNVRVVGLVPCTDNLPGGSAVKPGDVIRIYGGKTVEVINTDAEGRLILADALERAQEFSPDYVVDLATLTGACVVALGRRATGLFSASDDLRERLVQAGTEAHERLWPMPHWEDYQEELRSRVADLKNVGGKYGGAVTAFAFLRNFAGDRSWAHLDIAGTAWDMPQTEYYEGGATGTAVRTLLRFLAKLG